MTKDNRLAAERWPHLFSHNLDAITAPLWGMNPGGGRFYAPNRRGLTTLEKLDLLKGVVQYVEAHDTDILDIELGPDGACGYPTGMPEAQKMTTLRAAVAKYAAALAERGLKPGMWTMNLFSSDPLFNFGNFGSEVEEARTLAINRTIEGMSIAQVLQCLAVWWNGTNGVDGLMSAEHAKRNALTYRAFVTVLTEMRKRFGDGTQPLAAETKPEEPKSRMYTPVTQSILAMAWRLAVEYPDLAGLLGVNPEVGHEVMVKLDPAMTYGEAMFHGLLYHTHLNDQGGDPGFDRDHPAGSMCLRGLVDIVWQLKVGGYRGLLGIDAQPRPTDNDGQQNATIVASAKRIRWAVTAARKIADVALRSLQKHHNQAAIDEYVDRTVFGIE